MLPGVADLIRELRRICGTDGLVTHPHALRTYESAGLLEQRRREHLAGEVFAVASGRAKAHLVRAVEGDPELQRLLDAVQRRELDPLSAVREIMEKVFKLHDGKGS